MHGALRPGQIVDFSSPDIVFAERAKLPKFGVRGPTEGHKIRTWQDRLDVSEAADASALLMRSIKAAGDDVLCSAVTVTGQLIVWCRNSIYYTGNAQEADSVWMAPRNREFLAAQILLESNEWFNFWLATSVPAAQCSPVERVAAAAPGSGFRKVHRADEDLAVLGSECVDSCVLLKSASVFFYSQSRIGHLFSHLTMECVVLLPRYPPIGPNA